MEESKDTQADQTLEDQFHEEVNQVVAQGKKKRTLSEAQLATLAAGRKKRWSKKPVSPVLEEKVEEKEEEKVEEKEDVEVGKKKKTKLPVLEQSSSSDDSDDSCSSSGEDTSGTSSSDDYVSYPSASDQSSDSDLCSSDEIDMPPPPLPVLRRQKARDLTAEKNARSARKMREYIQKKSLPYLQRPPQLFL